MAGHDGRRTGATRRMEWGLHRTDRDDFKGSRVSGTGTGTEVHASSRQGRDAAASLEAVAAGCDKEAGWQRWQRSQLGQLSQGTLAGRPAAGGAHPHRAGSRKLRAGILAPTVVGGPVVGGLLADIALIKRGVRHCTGSMRSGPPLDEDA